jgi:hypothetical protein
MSTARKQRRKESLSRRQRIAKRLAAYSVAAAGAVAIGGQQADASIAYQPLNQTATQSSPVTFGVSGSALTVTPSEWHNVGLWRSRVDVTGTGGNGVNQMAWVWPGWVQQPVPLDPGAVIGNNLTFTGNQPLAMRGAGCAYSSSSGGAMRYYFWSPYNDDLNAFPAGHDKYLGLKLHFSDGTDHYGWLRMTISHDPNGPIDDGYGYLRDFRATIEGFAYETAADTRIVAGAKISGDADLNSTVNGADLNIVLSNYNQTGVGWAQGDFDDNGTVNGADLNVVLSNYNQSVSLGAAVPEPSTLGMLALGAVGVLAWKGWRKRT